MTRQVAIIIVTLLIEHLVDCEAIKGIPNGPVSWLETEGLLKQLSESVFLSQGQHSPGQGHRTCRKHGAQNNHSVACCSCNSYRLLVQQSAARLCVPGRLTVTVVVRSDRTLVTVELVVAVLVDNVLLEKKGRLHDAGIEKVGPPTPASALHSP